MNEQLFHRYLDLRAKRVLDKKTSGDASSEAVAQDATLSEESREQIEKLVDRVKGKLLALQAEAVINLEAGVRVNTFAGPGTIATARAEDTLITVTLDWKLAQGQGATAHFAPANVALRTELVPGARVKTFAGVGMVTGDRAGEGRHRHRHSRLETRPRPRRDVLLQCGERPRRR